MRLSHMHQGWDKMAVNFASCKRDLNNEWIKDYDGIPILAQSPPRRRETRSERSSATKPTGRRKRKELRLNCSMKQALAGIVPLEYFA